jgi:ring-1,2-phenylacetyl-CoA epoxidase subunit PaaE
MPDRIRLTIRSVTRETEDTYTYQFEPERPITYQAGQFFTLLLTINGRELRRSYSLSTDPGTDAFPAVTVKRIPNGEVSRFILDYWEEGTSTATSPAAGKFVLPVSDTPRDIFLVAAGSGITPMLGLIKQVLRTEPKSQIHLLYSNRKPEQTIFYDTLNQLQQQHPAQLHIHYYFSNGKHIEKARLTVSNLENTIQSSLTFAPADARFFICGPFEYMQMTRIGILSLGYTKEQLLQENFDPQTIPPPPRAPWMDLPPQQVTFVDFDGTYEFEVKSDETILDAALRQDIPLPYSCQGGACSSCMLKCKEGKVEMHYNEVLTDEDIAEGWVLTCTGHPMKPSVLEI